MAWHSLSLPPPGIADSRGLASVKRVATDYVHTPGVVVVVYNALRANGHVSFLAIVFVVVD